MILFVQVIFSIKTEKATRLLWLTSGRTFGAILVVKHFTSILKLVKILNGLMSQVGILQRFERLRLVV